MHEPTDIERFCRDVGRIRAERRARLDAIFAMTDKKKAREALEQFNAEYSGTHAKGENNVPDDRSR